MAQSNDHNPGDRPAAPSETQDVNALGITPYVGCRHADWDYLDPADASNRNRREKTYHNSTMAFPAKKSGTNPSACC